MNFTINYQNRSLTYKKYCFVITLLFTMTVFSQAEKITFAHISDTHVGTPTGAEDLELSIQDINANPAIEFVIHTGDVTEFGSDEEFALAKKLLDKLNKPYYVIPGNHDSKWSESGCNSFIKYFGSESFHFEKKGYLFIGTASGPNMRMGPGQIPREHIVFLTNTLQNMKDSKMPIININHYPLDKGLANYDEALTILKTRNIQLHINGHGHANGTFDFEGIPGIMGRSSLREDKHKKITAIAAAYNIVTIDKGEITYFERRSGKETLEPWVSLKLKDINFSATSKSTPLFDASINDVQKNVSLSWKKQLSTDVGCGIAVQNKQVYVAATNGDVTAFEAVNGKEKWRVNLGCKLYSTPAIAKNILVIGTTNNAIEALSCKDGSKIWKFTTDKSVLSSPTIVKNVVYIGASDGVFRAINLLNGNLIWEYKEVENFVETKPLVYLNHVYFGSWGNTFYALHQKTGKLAWKSTKSTNRMVSPAAVFPVGLEGKVYIVAPDRFMTAFDAKTGKEIFYSKDFSCRESIGANIKDKIVYIKTMLEGDLCAFDATSTSQKLLWRLVTNLGYEISPSPIVAYKDLVYIPSQNGKILAVDTKTKQLVWDYKISNTLVNNVVPYKNLLFGTTMDGVVFCLQNTFIK